MRFDRFVLMIHMICVHFHPIFAPNQHAFAAWKSEDLRDRKSFVFGTTRAYVNDDRNFILG